MDVVDCIRTRRSIRKFLDKPVEWEKVATVVDAGRSAPSAGNLQNWKFTVILDEAKRKDIAEACLQQYWIQKAPVIVVVTGEPAKSERFYGVRGARLYSIQNCAAAVENMLLTAHAQGLGACWVSAFDEDMVKRVLGIKPESGDIRPQAVIPIGYAGEQPPEPSKHPLTTVLFLDGYGSRVTDVNEWAGFTSTHVQKLFKKGKSILEKVTKKVAKKK